MGKYLKTEEKKPKGRLIAIVIVLIVIVALLAVFILPGLSGDIQGAEKGTEPQQTQAAAEEQSTAATADPTVSAENTEAAAPALEFPLLLEDGKLEIANVFQYEGMNPDCNNEDGSDVASIMLTNTSDAYLAEAKITLELADGTALNFTVHELPAGKTAMVFSSDNTPVEEEPHCVNAVCTASWVEELDPLPEDIGLTVDGVAVTVTNNTGADISELVIYCHCPLDEEYFGGIAYQYTVNNLSANESTTVEAWDCILGMAEVVRIAVNQE